MSSHRSGAIDMRGVPQAVSFHFQFIRGVLNKSSPERVAGVQGFPNCKNPFEDFAGAQCALVISVKYT
jgi:hypothetical protein